MHLDDERVQRLLHGELGSPGEARAREHLAECPECREWVTQAEQEEAWVLDRLRRLDHAPPRVRVEIVSPVRRRAPAWGRLAAGIMLAAAVAGVAYAAPGSPLAGVLHRVVEWVGGPAAATAPASAIERPQAGVAVPPGERLTIVFATEQSDGIAIVSLSDGAEVEVRALGGTTTFSSDVDRLSIRHRGPSPRFEIAIPRAAPSVEIRAGDRRVFLKKGSSVLTESERDGEGRYPVPLTRSPP